MSATDPPEVTPVRLVEELPPAERFRLASAAGIDHGVVMSVDPTGHVVMVTLDTASLGEYGTVVRIWRDAAGKPQVEVLEP